VKQKIKDFIRKDFKERVNGVFTLSNLQDNDIKKRFNTIKYKYSSIYQEFQNTQDTLDTKSIGYDWGSWSGKIRETFKSSVPIDFLSNPLISMTMVFKRISGVKETEDRIKLLETVFNEQKLKKLIVEDYIGKPTISNAKYKTSANRTHHASHLSFYKKAINENFWETNTIVEFGGGYGNMARILRKMNPNLTYIIIDLPELLSLQYIYLGSLEQEENLNIINEKNLNIVQNKINLVSSELIYSNKINIATDSFISTWALSESPDYLQEFVVKKNFFNAKRLLLASYIDDNNKLNKIINFNDIEKVKVPFLSGEHEYWLR
jgi:putative sugar O-methyltransferase